MKYVMRESPRENNIGDGDELHQDGGEGTG
jgi:hypothetical protein